MYLAFGRVSEAAKTSEKNDIAEKIDKNLVYLKVVTKSRQIKSRRSVGGKILSGDLAKL